jgi:hypothetical protein
MVSVFTGGACAPESKGNSMAISPIIYFMKHNYGNEKIGYKKPTTATRPWHHRPPFAFMPHEKTHKSYRKSV